MTSAKVHRTRSAKNSLITTELQDIRLGIPELETGRPMRSIQSNCNGKRSYTPTGNGLALCSSPRSRIRLSKRPWSNDIRPVYQYPKTNKNKNGTVM
jgi:hypothetical protein